MKNDAADVKQRLRDLQHFGEEGGVVPVIDLAATTTFLKPQDMEKTFLGEKHGCYLYSRHSNPTVNMFSAKMATLEKTEAALGVSSGMAAISSTIEQLMPEGGEILSSLTVYGGTYALFKNIFPRQGIHTKFVDIENTQALEQSITPKTKIIYTESISNPLLNLSSLNKISVIAKKYNLKFIVDNTFAPCLINPVEHGADVIIHSCTKYISGSSDMIAGAICGTHEFISQLTDVNSGIVMLKGPVMDAKSAHELYMRLDHLPLRMKAHSDSAMHLASGLYKSGLPVVYPGLDSHPQHEEYKKILNKDFGYGGMVVIELASAEKAMQLAQSLQNIKFGLYAVSLGFSRTLMTVPAVTTSSEISEEDQTKMKLKKGLLRLSVGYTGNDEVMLRRFMSAYNELMRN